MANGVSIFNNTITNGTYYIVNVTTANTVNVSQNTFIGNAKTAQSADTNATLNMARNWWGGITDVPPIWRTLAHPVSREQGLPKIRDVDVRNVVAVGARLGFDAASFADSPMRRFRFEGLRLDVQEAGSIANAEDWSFVDSEIAGLDGRTPTVTDSNRVVIAGPK